MQNLSEFRKDFDKTQHIIIIPHRRPDADALGSCLALKLFFDKLGKQSTVISPDEYPDFLEWMPQNDRVLCQENSGHQKAIRKVFAEAEMIFCLDFSSLDRIEGLTVAVRRSDAIKILVDHHHGKEDFAKYEIWDTTAAATAELIYDFILMLEGKSEIDLDIASCIYAGIMTDTGSFKYASTSSKVHRIVADLLDLGLKQERIHRLIFDTNSENRIKLLGYTLDKKLKILKQYSTAYISVTAQELKTFSSKTGDTEGIVNYALSIEGIKMAAMFTERPDGISISFRSVGSFAVNEFAHDHFGGGGHRNASGAKVEKPLEEVIQHFLGLLPTYEQALQKAES